MCQIIYWSKEQGTQTNLIPQLRNLLEHSIVPVSSKLVVGVSAVNLHSFCTSLLAAWRVLTPLSDLRASASGKDGWLSHPVFGFGLLPSEPDNNSTARF